MNYEVISTQTLDSIKELRQENVDLQYEANKYKDLLDDAYGSLQSMLYYADDGMVSRNDPDFKVYFADIDKAKEVLEKIDKVLENG